MFNIICLILTVTVIAFGIVKLIMVAIRTGQTIYTNAAFRYNRELAKRFVSDLKLPVSVIYPEHVFMHQLNLYENEYGAMTKWDDLWKMIDAFFDSDANKFLHDYYAVRDKIIVSTLDNPAYKEFIAMDMKKFSFKRPEGVSKNNVYNGENIDRQFLSIDLSKANFQSLRYVNPDIVLGAETYEDFIHKFTPFDYIAKSKYSRQVIFGKLNVDRQMTVQKWLINEIYNLLCESSKLLDEMQLVSMSNDELVYDVTNANKDSVIDLTEWIIKEVKEKLNLNVHTEFYTIKGWQLVSPTNSEICQTFFEKVNLIDDSHKLVCVPLPFHNIIYKLLNEELLISTDRYFIYEKMLCEFTDDFELKVLENTKSKKDGKEKEAAEAATESEKISS